MERFYCSYGSNLSQEQMKERCPNSHPMGKVVLTGYQLCFDEYSSRWGGGVATIAKKVGHQAAGALYQLTKEDEKKLDSFEKVPMVYKKIIIHIDGYPKNSIFTYIKPLKYNLAPSLNYLTKIAQGHRDFGLNFCHLKEALCRSGYVGNAIFLEKNFLTLSKSLQKPNFRLPSSCNRVNGEIFFYDNQKNSLLNVLNELDKYHSRGFIKKIALFPIQKTVIPAWYYEKNE